MTVKTYARIQDGAVAELFETDQDIADLFHPDLVWVECSGAAPATGDLYSGGVFGAPPEHAPTEDDIRLLARTLLAASDRTVLRCMEDGLAVPGPWKTYRTALRPIAGTGDLPADGWPQRPAYPDV